MLDDSDVRPDVYLDAAATIPMREAALAEWIDAVHELQDHPGNPSSLHAGGRRAAALLADARARVASCMWADPAEIVFTSGATESDALGVMGTARAVRAADPARTVIAASGIEHPAVAAQAPVAQREGFKWHRIGTRPDGVAEAPAAAPSSIEDPDQLAVVSLALVCSEIGTIQPVVEYADWVHENAPGAKVHSDAAQAFECLDVDVRAIGADLITVAGHKIGAPIGVGALYVRRGTELVTDRPGGGQESQRRSGTADVAGALAFAAALEEAVSMRHHIHRHWTELRAHLLRGLPEGVALTTEAATTPGIVHLSIPTEHPEAVIMVMDRAGVQVSAGSACHSGVARPSDVLLAMGRTEAQAMGALRVSFLPETRAADLDRFLAALPEALAAAQALDGAAGTGAPGAGTSGAGTSGAGAGASR